MLVLKLVEVVYLSLLEMAVYQVYLEETQAMVILFNFVKTEVQKEQFQLVALLYLIMVFLVCMKHQALQAMLLLELFVAP